MSLSYSSVETLGLKWVHEGVKFFTSFFSGFVCIEVDLLNLLVVLMVVLVVCGVFL